MTVSSTEAQAVTSESVLFRYQEQKVQLTLSVLHGRIARLESLLDFAFASSASRTVRVTDDASWAYVASSPGASSTRVRSRRYAAPTVPRRKYVIESIAYNSPLEIVLQLSGIVGAGAYGLNRLLRLWDAWNASRVKRADANVAVARSEARVDALTFIRSEFGELAKANPKKAREAAKALSILDDVRQLE